MNDIQWGLRPGPDDGAPTPVWGARAIYHQDAASFDLLPDRQSCTGGTDESRAQLVQWLIAHGIPALRKLLAREKLPSNSQETVEIRDHGFVLRASPRRSYGHLYVGAWPIPPSASTS
jgi:hypothetical protein